MYSKRRESAFIALKCIRFKVSCVWCHNASLDQRYLPKCVTVGYFTFKTSQTSCARTCCRVQLVVAEMQAGMSEWRCVCSRRAMPVRCWIQGNCLPEPSVKPLYKRRVNHSFYSIPYNCKLQLATESWHIGVVNSLHSLAWQVRETRWKKHD